MPTPRLLDSRVRENDELRGRNDVSRRTRQCARLGTSPSATFCVADLFRGLSIALCSTGLLRVDAHKGHPYGCFGEWWDASGHYRAGWLTLAGDELQH